MEAASDSSLQGRSKTTRTHKRSRHIQATVHNCFHFGHETGSGLDCAQARTEASDEAIHFVAKNQWEDVKARSWQRFRNCIGLRDWSGRIRRVMYKRMGDHSEWVEKKGHLGLQPLFCFDVGHVTMLSKASLSSHCVLAIKWLCNGDERSWDSASPARKTMYFGF